MDNFEKMIQAVMNAHTELSAIASIDCSGLTTSQAFAIESQRLKIHKQLNNLEKMVRNFKNWTLTKEWILTGNENQSADFMN